MDDIEAQLGGKLGPLPTLSVSAKPGPWQAAVLVPIVDHPGAPTVLLTRRADHLRAHAGQVSFPGGRIEPTDAAPAEAALREAFEEIGLARDFIRLMGALAPRETGTGFFIHPVVGLVRPGFSLKPDPSEVAEILEVPLAALMDPQNHARHRTNWNGVEHTHYVINVGDLIIWGATAGLIVDLSTRLSGADEAHTAPLSLARQPWVADPATRQVIGALEAKGSPARFVGGCVRNALIGAPIADIDIATPEEPQSVLELLAAAGLKAVPTGIDHGTVTAVASGKSFEITTLRRDVTTDGRRATVAFTRDFGEDAGRRDFTVNAIYADESGLLYDYVGGVSDLLTRRVRFIGDPEARIAEDYLRILRFFRFHAWYGRGNLDPAGFAAAAKLKSGMAQLSAERIAHELLRLLEAPAPMPALAAMGQAGILALVLPEAEHLERLGRLMAGEMGLGLQPDALLRLAALLPAEPARATALALRLKFSGEMRTRLTQLAEDDGTLMPGLSPVGIRAACYRTGFALYRDRVMLRFARNDETAFVPHWSALIEAVESWPVPRFPLSGADLRARGVPEGVQLGRLLSELEADWIAGDFKSDRVQLLAALDEKLKKNPS
jgi:poly(A) polymerase